MLLGHYASYELPARRLQITEAVAWQQQSWLVSVGFDRTGRAREIFLKGCKSGSDIERLADDIGIVLSRLLQRGERAQDLFASLRGDHDVTGECPPTLILAALGAAARLEREQGEAIEEAYLCAEGKHPLQTEERDG